MIKYFLAAFLCLVLSVFIYQGCKDNNTVQPPTTTTTQNPNSPVLKTPANNTTTQVQAPLLDWDDFTGATSYRVQISLDANFAGIMLEDSSGLTSSQFQVPANTLTTGVYFYWRTIANTPAGLSNWSITWRFRVILAPPAAPTLLLPVNGANNQYFMPLLDWNDVPTTQYYHLQLSPQQNFSPLILDTSGITISQLLCPFYALSSGTQYYWRVNGSNSNGASTGPWSATFSFTTAVGPQPHSISGLVTFADTNVVYPIYQYIIGAYNTWPPSTYTPFATDTLVLHKNGNTYSSNYIMRSLPDSSYILAVYYQASPLLYVDPVLGIYGCDTNHIPFSSCPQNPTHITINGGTGVDNVNFSHGQIQQKESIKL